MTVAAGALLPDGFVVRLHDDVELGALLVSGHRVVRLSAAARALVRDRSVEVGSRSAARLAGMLLDLDVASPELDRLAGPAVDELTVVIPVRDNAGGVDRLLSRVAPHLTCLVVDDASSDADALADVVARHGAQLIRLDRNVGPAAARNRGADAATTPFVAFIDSDVEATVDDLRRLLHNLTDPALAAVAPRIRSTDDGTWLGRYERTSGALDLGPRAATTRPWSSVAYVPSACLVARVDLLGAGFDEQMRSGEDVDLVWRLRGAGLRVRYAAEVQVRHDARRSLRDWLGRKAFYGTSAAPLAQRHGSLMAPAVMSPAAAIAVAGPLVQRRWAALPSVLGAAVFLRATWSRPPDLPTGQKIAVTRTTAAAMVWQTSGLVLRHWAPATVALMTVSSRARRAAVVLGVADGVLAYRSTRPDLDPVRFVAARRAEHAAYGAGVWWGAVVSRSARCLVPHWVPSLPPRAPRS